MGLFSKIFGKSPAEAVQSSSPKGRILVVETSVTVSKVIELSLPDFVVTTAATIQQARTSLSSVAPDLVIASVALPDGDSYEFCKAVAADRLRPSPVILLHGAFEAIDKDRAKSCGASAVLTKPFEPAKLRAAIEQALGEPRVTP